MAFMASMRAGLKPTAAAAQHPITEWTVAVKVVAKDYIERPPLTFVFVDEETGHCSCELDASGFASAPWPRPGNKEGQTFTGTLQVPSRISPGALKVHYKGKAPAADQPKTERIWVAEVKLSTAGWVDITISAHGWVNKLNSPRVFFEGRGRLPSQTPHGMRHLRERELDIIKGVGNPRQDEERQFSDRIQEYDVYNDLSRLPQNPKPDDVPDIRPILGGPDSDYKYPRRLRTGRPVHEDGQEINPVGDDWVPQDEDFDQIKSDNFTGNTLDYLILPLIALQLKTAVGALNTVNERRGLAAGFTAVYLFFKNLIGSLSGQDKLLDDPDGYMGGVWNSFRDVMAIYRNKGPSAVAGPTNLAAQAKVGGSNRDMRKIFRSLSAKKQNAILQRQGIPRADWDARAKRIDRGFWKSLSAKVNSVLQWETPLVEVGKHYPPLASDGDNPPERHGAWQTDEEYGRQWVAGQNPMVITAPSALPIGTITGAHIDGLLDDGDTLQTLLSRAGTEPGLFLVDYWEPFRSYATRIDAQDGDNRKGRRKQHAGRLLLYKQPSSGHLLPIAIELWHDDGTQDGRTAVYTPAVHKNVWLLAKAIFASLDSGYHQLVSHLLRTHECEEPYILATNRCLSAMHPVYKLLTPHFQFTLRMNANARTTLTNVTGILEATFTSGQYTMRLSAEAYRTWKFKEQGLPHDLVARRMARRIGDEGEVHILLDDYPYAEDGLLIWDALRDWNDDYLSLYYDGDADVANDEELQAWWTEITTKGHADADSSGWPGNTYEDGIRTVAELSDITTTMAWMASAHHAAVNFGQYDYSGLPLNRSPLIRAAIPERGTHAYKELTSEYPETSEQAFLTYIANPWPATRMVALYTVLSQHAPNEHYLSDADQGLVYDGEALKLHRAFVADIKAAEEIIKQRNAPDTPSMARSLTEGGLPYNYLMPSSPAQTQQARDDLEPNITGRGIPYSISI